MSDAQQFVAKIEWESDDDFRFPLATNMVVNFDREHFYIRFYQATPPVVLGEDSPPVSVKAKLVSGIAIPISKMGAVVDALRENYDKRIELSQDAIEFDLDAIEDAENANE